MDNDYIQHKYGKENEKNRGDTLIEQNTYSSTENYDLNKETQNYVDEMKIGVNTILVAVRVRPLNSRELAVSNFETIKVMDQKVICLLDPQNEFEPEDVNNLL